VETEAKVEDDRALIAGVYVNRLDPKKWPTGLLDADPTLNYANDSVWLSANPIDGWVNYTFLEPDQGDRPSKPGRIPRQPGAVQHVPPRRPASDADLFAGRSLPGGQR